ncbi:DUF1275 family protein [Rhizobium oryziradicis]|uniref:DUF1275 family protein n=1 Tax=Rhizobium oryziradicis TaxID=1867956 RepID=A0A1Q8ZUL0_9HYPH|nr:DUF1275 family protein [Rhizobium oryziradicis]OLP45750.1 hypothetical protein BJF95_11540 [Rhizobium oryziradicis]
MAKPHLAVVLSLNAGYVDTMGFLALAGLFTAHVTGNFVTLGAASVFGSSGGLAKLLALPVFCIIVLLTGLLMLRLKQGREEKIRLLLVIQLLFLIAAAVMAVLHGPLQRSDQYTEVTIGMTLVIAMAIQNGLHRIHLGKLPPTTLMTGTTTQIMLDAAELLNGSAGSHRPAIIGRMKRMIANLAAFAIGCAGAAIAITVLGMWCFVIPPVIQAIAFFTETAEPDA